MSAQYSYFLAPVAPSYLRKQEEVVMTAGYSYREQLHLVTANAPVRSAAGKVTMADSFEASIAGYTDWLPAGLGGVPGRPGEPARRRPGQVSPDGSPAGRDPGIDRAVAPASC